MSKTVWVYVDRNKKIGDADHVKVFASSRAADRWLKKHNRAGAAFRYKVLRAEADSPLEAIVPGKKKAVSNGELTTIFFRMMRSYSDCPRTGTPVAIVPSGRGSEWTVLTAPYLARRYPKCAKRVEAVKQELQKIYALRR
jgi:hypothetical protein